MKSRIFGFMTLGFMIFAAAMTALTGESQANTDSGVLLDRLLTSTAQDIRDAEARIAHNLAMERKLEATLTDEDRAGLAEDLRAQREEVVDSFTRAVGLSLPLIRTENRPSTGIDFDARALVASYIESRVTRSTYFMRIRAFKLQNWMGLSDDRLVQYAREKKLALAESVRNGGAHFAEASGIVFWLPGGAIPAAGVLAVGATSYAAGAIVAAGERRKIYLGLSKLILVDQLRTQLYTAIYRAAEARL